jgi:hypothetical protein
MSTKIEPGTRVIYHGEFFDHPGIVMAISGHTARIEFDDGDEGWERVCNLSLEDAE